MSAILRQLRLLANRKDAVLYLDATGSVGRKIENQNRVLYYPVLLKTKPGDPPVPIA